MFGWKWPFQRKRKQDKAESIRRLRILRSFLITNVKPENFDLNWWELDDLKCALGWATCIPEFQKLGLYMSEGGILFDMGVPRFKNKEGITAGAKFFGISKKQARYIFLRSYYPKGSKIPDVCKHISNVISELILDGI